MTSRRPNVSLAHPTARASVKRGFRKVAFSLSTDEYGSKTLRVGGIIFENGQKMPVAHSNEDGASVECLAWQCEQLVFNVSCYSQI